MIYPDYQIGTLRAFLPDATWTGQDVSENNIRNKQADQTFLAGNGVDNSLPHREVDFGALIWSAFGNRLLSDWGYGELSKSYEFYDVQGAAGAYIASNEHYLQFSLKHISGTLDVSRLFVSFKLRGRPKEVSLGNYVSELTDDWVSVTIPLSDFSLNGQDWTGNGQGLEYIRLKTSGFVKGGEFGLDEIKIIDAQASDGIIWYGDSHGES